MWFPFGFNDISLFLAITAIILLATSELLSSHYSQTRPFIERGRLRRVARASSDLALQSTCYRQVVRTHDGDDSIESE